MVRLAETGVLFMQGAEFRDGVVICRDKTKHDRALYIKREGSSVRAETRGSRNSCLKALVLRLSRPALLVLCS
jgi:hypothetical protein